MLWRLETIRSIYYIERMFQKVVKTGCNIGCKQREKWVFVITEYGEIQLLDWYDEYKLDPCCSYSL